MREEEREALHKVAQEIERRWPDTLTEIITDRERKGFLKEEDLDAIIEVYKVPRSDLRTLREFTIRSTLKLLKEHNLFIAILPHDVEATQKFYSQKVTEVLMVKEGRGKGYSSKEKNI